MIDNLMWAVTAASIAGSVGNIKKKRWGFMVWTLTNTAWVTYDIWKGAYAQSVMMVVFTGLSIWGWFAWKES